MLLPKRTKCRYAQLNSKSVKHSSGKTTKIQDQDSQVIGFMRVLHEMLSARSAKRLCQTIPVRAICTPAHWSPNALVLTSGTDSAARSAVTVALECCQSLGGEVDVLLAEQNAKTNADRVARWRGVRTVFALNRQPLAEPVANAAALLVPNYGYVISAATSFGKGIVPRLGGVLQCETISDVVKVGEQTTESAEFTHPIYAGNALTRVSISSGLRLVTVRTTAFEPVVERAANETSAVVESMKIAELDDPKLSRWVKHESTKTERPDLTTANVVVAGGRALKTAEQFKMLEELADVLGGAVGATRAAVDSGLCPNDMQIGQTGKIVAPSLYFGFGISGAIQHLAGIKDSKVIVAVNKDPEAPIVQVADYTIMGDVFEILPKLTNLVKQSTT